MYHIHFHPISTIPYPLFYLHNGAIHGRMGMGVTAQAVYKPLKEPPTVCPEISYAQWRGTP